jgi:hypothetical protein
MTTRALIVPDEQTWTVLGTDPAALGLEPTFALGGVERVLVPEAVPDPLAEPLRACLAAIPANAPVERRALALAGGELTGSGGTQHDRAEQALRGHRGAAHSDHHARHQHTGDRRRHAEHGTNGGHHDHGEHNSHADHHDQAEHDTHAAHDRAQHDAHGGEHDHHDMMAIVGEASGDGLVMESIELRYGPLGTPLPGGLAVDVTLDGDVVAEATVEALLEAPADPLAPVAASAPPGWDGVAAVERERAVSHLAWLRAFARLLGWRRLVGACTRAIEATRDPVGAQPAMDALVAMVRGSRLLRTRTRGLGVVTADQARTAGLRGPNARASGLAHDERSGDPRYLALGFEPVTRTGGDALARTLVRVDEVRAAVRLAAAASRADGEAPSAGPGKGPRCYDGASARRVAGEAMVGAEWSAALAILASFDLSPWQVSS